jgi:hypothetical protein
MRNILKYTLVLLMTTYGTAKLVAAQTLSPAVSDSTTATLGKPETDVLALPRVVPPPPALPPKVFITPVSASAPKPAMDLLTAPAVPPAWLAAPSPRSAKVTVIPSGLPGPAAAKSVASVPTTATPKVVPMPMVPVPVVSAARPALLPLTAAAPRIRTWPPAHLVRKNVQDQETHGASYIEPAPPPQAPAVLSAPVGHVK